MLRHRRYIGGARQPTSPGRPREKGDDVFVYGITDVGSRFQRTLDAAARGMQHAQGETQHLTP